MISVEPLQGTIVSGGQMEQTVCFSDVRVNSYSRLSRCVLFPGVDVGRGARLTRCIVDKGVRIPPGEVIGEDPARDRERFTVSPGGVVAVSRADFGQRDEFAGLRKRTGNVDQACRHPPRAVAHSLSNEFLHLVEFGGTWGAIFAAHRLGPERTMWNQMQNVRPRPAFFDLAVVGRHINGSRAAIAGDDRRTTLRQEVCVLPRLGLEDRIVAVRVQVDEARRDDHSPRVDFPRASLHREAADRDDAVVSDGQISDDSFAFAAVVKRAAAQDEVGGDGISSNERKY